MKINKQLGTELYNLFGPNGSDQFVHRSEKRRMSALNELARHGLVQLKPRESKQEAGLTDVIRALTLKP